MSYQTWHTYGYGICVSDIKECTVERLENLLLMAPNYQADIRQWMGECEITEPSLEDYLDFDQGFRLGLATLLKEVILESEGIELVACDSYDSMDYLLYCPSYPWHKNGKKLLATEEDAIALFQKYVAVLTDEEIDIGYQDVENGG